MGRARRTLQRAIVSWGAVHSRGNEARRTLNENGLRVVQPAVRARKVRAEVGERCVVEECEMGRRDVHLVVGTSLTSGGGAEQRQGALQLRAIGPGEKACGRFCDRTIRRGLPRRRMLEVARRVAWRGSIGVRMIMSCRLHILSMLACPPLAIALPEKYGERTMSRGFDGGADGVAVSIEFTAPCIGVGHPVNVVLGEETPVGRQVGAVQAWVLCPTQVVYLLG